MRLTFDKPVKVQQRCPLSVGGSSYAAGRRGVIMLQHGGHVLPDSNAHFDGEAPEHLYTVSFAAGDLWQHAESPDDTVCLDLWDSYLEPA